MRLGYLITDHLEFAFVHLAAACSMSCHLEVDVTGIPRTISATLEAAAV